MQLVAVNSEEKILDEPAGNLPVGAEKVESWVFGLKTGIGRLYHDIVGLHQGRVGLLRGRIEMRKKSTTVLMGKVSV